MRLTLITTIAAVLFTVAPAAPVSAHAAVLVKPDTGVVRAQSAQRTYLAAIAKQIATPPPAPVPLPVTDPNSFIWPVKRGAILSPFGPRGGRRHDGTDLDANTGDPIVASQDGTVAFVGWISGYGNTVKIDHGHGIETLYAHQSRTASHVGEVVEQGRVIGYAGSSGRVTTPHLHYEVHVNGVPRNPAPWL